MVAPTARILNFRAESGWGDGGNGAGGGSNPSIVGELGSATEAHLYTRELNKCAWRGIMRDAENE